MTTTKHDIRKLFEKCDLKFRHRILIRMGILPFPVFAKFYDLFLESSIYIGQFMKDQLEFNDMVAKELDILYDDMDWFQENDERGVYQ